MPIAKRQAIKLIKSMPDESTTADIMAELYFKQKVERGLKDVEDGKTLSHADVKKKLAKWAKSIGQ